MKKVALLLATLMVISLLPMATFAADLTQAADDLTITAKSGTVNYMGSAYNNEYVGVTDVLTDGNVWSYAVAGARSRGANGQISYNDDSNKNVFVHFAPVSKDSELVFSWESGKAVRRIDLWYASRDSIRQGVEVYIPDGDGGWKLHYSGNDNYTGVYAVTSEYGKDRQASYYPILFDPVPADTTSLRLVLKETNKQSDYGVKVAEARISTSNDYDFLAAGGNAGVIGVDDNYPRQNWSQQYMSGTVVQSVVASATDATYQQVFHKDMINTNNYVWPTNRDYDGNSYHVTANSLGECWFAMSANQAKYFNLKGNRFKVSLADGTAEGFDVYNLYAAKSGSSLYEKLYYAGTQATAAIDVSGWTHVGSYSGPVTPESSAELDITGTINKANFWLIVMKNPSADIKVSDINMYLYQPSELVEATAAGSLTGTVAPGQTVKYTASFEGKSNEEASILFALYEGDKLVDIAAPGAIKMNGTGIAGASYTIPSDAAASGLTVKAFLWNNLNDLQPLQAPITLAQ